MEKQTALQFHPTPDPAAVEVDQRRQSRCNRCERRFRAGAAFCPYDGEPLVEVEGALTDPLLGTLVDGRFEVLETLGEGGMGVVYRVRHRVLGREFALKALRADVAQEAQLGERFLREAQSAASINHPNVCEITDFGELGGKRPYFVMELLQGESLSALLTRGERLALSRVIHLTEQIAKALEAAHQAGVVHRDLKPDNIIVESTPTEERVKVVDFGLAKVVGHSRLTQPGVVFGTPHYMSPEQASGGDVDSRADVYALGVMIYEMLTGKVPFEAETYMGVLSKHLYLEPVPPSRIVPSAEFGALEEVVLRCLQKKPEDRYASMGDLLEELKSIVRVDGGRVSVRPGELHALPPVESEPQQDLPRSSRRGPPVLAISLVFALSAIGAVIFLATGAGVGVKSPPTATGVAASFRGMKAPSIELPALIDSNSVPWPDGISASGTGGTPGTATHEDSRPRIATSAPELDEGPEDPTPSEKRPPTTKKRANFQTSEIIDPWSQ